MVVIALSTEDALTISRGFRSSQTMSTMRRPVSVAMRAWRESAAGIDAEPGSVNPSASVAEVIVDAVPMVMQWPAERDMHDSPSIMSLSFIWPVLSISVNFHT